MKTNALDSWLSQVRSHITSCLNCQPYEDGEPVWMDEPVCLDDLFDRYAVPEFMRRRVTQRLRCRVCHSRFEQYSIIGIELRPGESAGDRKLAA